MPERAAGPSTRAGTSWAARLGLVAAAVLVAALAAPLATFTWQSSAVTGAIGLAVVAALVTGRPRRVGRPVRPRSGTWPILAWVLVFAGIAALELGALAWGDRPQFPTLSWLVGPYFTEPAVRFAGYVAWICSGFWLVRR